MSSPFPKCSICGHSHAKALAHIWDEAKPVTAEDIAHPPYPEISRGKSGRGVAASADDPVTVVPKKREDEEVARRSVNMPAESSQPPQSFENFRRAYQRIYMQDLAKAQAEGLTVKAYRLKHSINWRDRL